VQICAVTRPRRWGEENQGVGKMGAFKRRPTGAFRHPSKMSGAEIFIEKHPAEKSGVKNL
jgi:hypothetical protein